MKGSFISGITATNELRPSRIIGFRMPDETSGGSDEEISIERAAEMLRISTGALTKKLDANEIRFHYVASERRVVVADLLDYRRRQREQVQMALKRMRDEADEIGIYD